MSPHTAKRWLLASVVLNVFLVGAGAGVAWRWWATQGAAGAATVAAAPRSLRYAADDMAADQRRTYLLGLRNARREVAIPIRASRDGRREVLRLVAAPQFDRDAIMAALAQLRDSDMAARTRLETSVVDFAATLTTAERQQFVAGLERRSQLGSPEHPAAKP
jgi:uncharacterized membrane protein